MTGNCRILKITQNGKIFLELRWENESKRDSRMSRKALRTEKVPKRVANQFDGLCNKNIENVKCKLNV